MQDLEKFHKDKMAKPSVNGRPSETAAAVSELPADPQEEQQDQTLSPEIVKKLSRPGEIERASKEIR